MKEKTIVENANSIIRGSNFTKLRKLKSPTNSCCTLIVNAPDYAMYMSTTNSNIYVVDNQGQGYKLI